MNLWLILNLVRRRTFPLLIIIGSILGLLANIQGVKDLGQWGLAQLFPPTAAEMAAKKNETISKIDTLVNANKWDDIDDVLATLDPSINNDIIAFYKGMKEWSVRTMLRDPEQRFLAIGPDSQLHRQAVFMLMRLYILRRPPAEREKLLINLSEKLEKEGYNGTLLYSLKLLSRDSIRSSDYYEEILKNLDGATASNGSNGHIPLVRGEYISISLAEISGADIMRAALHGYLALSSLAENRHEDFNLHFRKYCALLPHDHSVGDSTFTKYAAPFKIIAMLDDHLYKAVNARCTTDNH
jgi:hypothetical protein